MNKIILKQNIPSIDKRLGRHINWDSRSAEFSFNTIGIIIKDTTHKRLIPILNQGNLASCTGNAGIGDINTSPFLGNKKIYTPDENGAVKLYSDAEKIDGGVGYPPDDVGSSGLSIAKALKRAGLISSYYHCFTLNDTLKAITKYPVIVGINWYSDMFNPDPDGRVHITGNLAGGHEIEAYKIDVENGRIWFYNSWVESWGISGTFYITWEDFFTLLSQQGDVIVLIPPVLRKGSDGISISVLQDKLNFINGCALSLDGIFGDKTKAQVEIFQKNNGLVVDGLVGPLTLEALNNII